MPMMSRSDYAKSRRERGLPGGSPPAVFYAIRDGRITTTPDGMIDSDLADKQWSENTNPGQQASGMKAGAARAAQIRAGVGKSQERTAASRSRSTGDNDDEGRNNLTTQLPTAQRSDYAASRASREYYEAEIARLKFEEKSRQLIPASLVRKVMYEAGRIVRAGHEDLKAQLSPDLAAATDISTAERLLSQALNDLDNRLADYIEKLDEKMAAEDEVVDDEVAA